MEYRRFVRSQNTGKAAGGKTEEVTFVGDFLRREGWLQGVWTLSGKGAIQADEWKQAAYFDQAARNVACVAEVLSRADRQPRELPSLGFFVLAPKEQVSRQVFSRQMSIKSIEQKVADRVSGYEVPDRDAKEQWFRDWFLPTLSLLKVECLCWEDVIDLIRREDLEFGWELSEFYAECLRFNRLQEPDLAAVNGLSSNVDSALR